MINGLSLRRRRDFSQILNDSFAVYQGPPLMPLLVILALPTVGLNLFFVALEETLPALLAAVLTMLLNVTIGLMLGSGAVHALDQLDRGQPVGALDSIRVALSRAGDLIWAHLRAILIVVGLMFTVIGIPFALARAISWYFVTHVIMIEGHTSETALDASRNLVAGRGWGTFGLLLGTGLVVAIFTGIPQLLVYAFVEGLTGRIILALVPLLTFPFQVTCTLLIYYDLKMRKALA